MPLVEFLVAGWRKALNDLPIEGDTLGVIDVCQASAWP